MRAAVPLALLAVLAGCVEVPAAQDRALTQDGIPTPDTTALLHRLDGRVASPAEASGLVAARGLALHTGLRAGEPTVGATRENVVFMTASFRDAAGQLQPTVVATADRGQTFQDVGPKVAGALSHHARSFDPYLYVDHDTGRVFMDDNKEVGTEAASVRHRFGTEPGFSSFQELSARIRNFF